MKGQPITWSDDELVWIEAHKELPRAEAFGLFQARFHRRDVSPLNYASLCKRKGWLMGRLGRFRKGDVPPN